MADELNVQTFVSTRSAVRSEKLDLPCAGDFICTVHGRNSYLTGGPCAIKTAYDLGRQMGRPPEEWMCPDGLAWSRFDATDPDLQRDIVREFAQRTFVAERALSDRIGAKTEKPY